MTFHMEFPAYIGVMNNPVKNSIRQGRVRKQLMPGGIGELARNNRCGSAMTPLGKFHDFMGFFRSELFQSPIIKDKQIDPGKLVSEGTILPLRPGIGKTEEKNGTLM
jgi:hypothetical protein